MSRLRISGLEPSTELCSLRCCWTSGACVPHSMPKDQASGQGCPASGAPRSSGLEPGTELCSLRWCWTSGAGAPHSMHSTRGWQHGQSMSSGQSIASGLIATPAASAWCRELRSSARQAGAPPPGQCGQGPELREPGRHSYPGPPPCSRAPARAHFLLGAAWSQSDIYAGVGLPLCRAVLDSCDGELAW